MNKIRCPLNAAAERHENLPALIADNKVISYGEYEQLVASTAIRLKEAGVAKGERVAIVSGNGWEYPILFFALLRLGAVVCPISPRIPPEAILSLLDKIDCNTVVDPVDRLSTQGSDKLRRIALDTIIKPRESRVDNVPVMIDGDSDRDATIIFTSGSSAHPKAVLHSVGNHHYSALGSNKNIIVQPGDRWLMSLPLYHVGGLGILFRTLLAGASVVIPAYKETIAESIEKHDVTHLSIVSTQLYRLLNDGLGHAQAGQLKAVLLGGSAVPASLITRAHKIGLPLYTSYGLTEMTSQVTTTIPGDSLEHLLTSGKLLAYRNLKLDDDKEIFVKGETLFKGYVDGAVTTLPVDDDGWFRTGDLGRLNSDGYLEVTGRKDNMFISGGENIHPEEIEHALCLLSGVSEAVVVPIEDQEFGFRPVAFIRSREGSRIDKGEIVSYLEQYLPRFKIPVSFYELPDETGQGRIKPDRHYLAKLAEDLKQLLP
ncbi:MAG: o-succinylbenzoate--CoA ligase [Desulfobacterales bacterium]|nr:o-succinylbenzoate--CoA ligase [Desulfobacterales bacterium]